MANFSNRMGKQKLLPTYHLIHAAVAKLQVAAESFMRNLEDSAPGCSDSHNRDHSTKGKILGRIMMTLVVIWHLSAIPTMALDMRINPWPNGFINPIKPGDMMVDPDKLADLLKKRGLIDSQLKEEKPADLCIAGESAIVVWQQKASTASADMDIFGTVHQP